MSDIDTALGDLDKAVTDELAYDKSLATEINNLQAAAAKLTTDGADTAKLTQAIADIEAKAQLLEANATPAAAQPADQMTTSTSIGPDAQPVEPPADAPPADASAPPA